MNDSEQTPNFWTRLKRSPRRTMSGLANGWSIARVKLRNRIRKWRRVQIDYVVLPIGGPLPERAAPRRGFIGRRLPFPAAAESMQQLNMRLQRIADADNVKGVVFIFRGFQAGLATIQNFRQSLLRLSEAGKETVVYTPFLDLRHYYAATAADRIIVPPGAQFDVLGLHAEVIFLKDALQEVGVKMEVVQISPYKTALDMVQHSEMTPEYREQLDWLLDEQFDMITAGLATGRSKSQAEMKSLINEAPYFAQSALEKGLIDDVAYEDQLATLLADTRSRGSNDADDVKKDDKSAEAGNTKDHNEAIGGTPRAIMRTWPQARKALLEKHTKLTRRIVGVISLEGLIVMGPSRRSPIDLPIPFVGGATAGEQTLVGLLRQAEKLDSMAALILHVDSGGGSALASEIIARQIQRINEKKPVLVYMGNVAASGGYYVSAQSTHIMSQQATMTGSIGVITARSDSHALFEKVKVNRISLSRGKRATLYSDQKPMTAEERQIFSDGIRHIYGDFKNVVARGRNLPFEELDPICEGRVWTGRQAQEHKLVDSHGDFVDAVGKAASLAGLEVDDHSQVKVVNLYSKKDGYVLPQPFEAANELSRFLSMEWIKELNGRPLMLMPFSLNMK
ncbi:MAG: signal peptide peptidase SppA [Chloroflexi bacterium]|jgi:protease-4|nr:signal peptide peptidase SppA [Chloroflexota bacterium]